MFGVGNGGLGESGSWEIPNGDHDGGFVEGGGVLGISLLHQRSLITEGSPSR